MFVFLIEKLIFVVGDIGGGRLGAMGKGILTKYGLNKGGLYFSDSLISNDDIVLKDDGVVDKSTGIDGGDDDDDDDDDAGVVV